jgi:two-component system, sensor histidine kinase YesM
VPDGCRELHIPRFCIQPILENCFVHALPGVSGRLRIDLTVRTVDDAVSVVVTDDGPGCCDSRWTEVSKGLSQGDDARGHGVGLYGVHQRLVVEFGPRFGVRRVNVDRGFSVEVRLPTVDT